MSWTVGGGGSILNTSMNGQRASFCLTLTLLVACVYQLGGSPCGCLDHNGWYQVFLSDAGQHHSGCRHDAASDAECDHAGRLAAVLSARARVDLEREGPAVGSTHAVSELLAAAGAEVWSSPNRPVVEMPAGTLRAHLQVFCL